MLVSRCDDQLETVLQRTPATAVHWCDPESIVLPLPGEVHVWRACFSRISDRLVNYKDICSRDEIERAGRFHREHDKIRFIVARIVVRLLLGEYLSEKPEAIRFAYGKFGKPGLVFSDNEIGLEFNLSHSCDWLVIAVACVRSVGVDIEYVNADIRCEEMLDTVFTRREHAFYYELPEDRRKESFFNLWTLKEAYIKAIGTGFSVSPVDIDMVYGDWRQNRLLAAPGESDPARWSVQQFVVEEGYAGALFVEGRVDSIRFMNWKILSQDMSGNC